MNRVVSGLIALAVAVAVVVGVVFFAFQGRIGGGQEPAGGEKVAAESQPAAPDTAPATPEDTTPAITVAPPPPQDFAFQRLAIQTDQDRPEACLVFSMDLDESGETNYADYVRLDGDAEISLRATGKSLCIAGLSYAGSYRATILAGMPAANGMKTPFEEVVPIELKDRPPAIAFSGGIILPREAGGQVPITTVNVETLNIRVLRVGDRLLSQLYQGLVDSTELYQYDVSQVENELGALVWEGQMAVEGAKNATVTTLLPARKAIGKGKPGVYLIMAANADDEKELGYRWQPTNSQWLIDTDLALTSFSGSDGLTMQVRSFASAEPLQGVRLVLVARNNEILAEARTGGDGMVKFAAPLMHGRGGNEPAVVMAYGASDDFAYADLRRPAFDLTDRGVDGRAEPGPIDSFVYLDRGIYRPGETVHAAALVRTNETDALTDAPLTLIARRPDGIEYRRIELKSGKTGGFTADIPLSATAPRGRWQIAAYIDPDGSAVGRASFDVQDFVPERLKVTLSPKAEIFRAGEEVKVDVEGRFLYGAPASGLGGEGWMRLYADPGAFEQHKDYVFGRVEESFGSQVIPLDITTTDAEGKAIAFAALPETLTTTYPLKALVSVGLFEPGGRQTREEITVPVRTADVYLGIRPAFDGGWVRENTPANFEVIAVDAKGEALARDKVTYRLVREVVNYHWYETDGNWRYERQTRDYPVADGSLAVAPGKPGKTGASLEWGSYRFIVSDAASGAQSSTRFWVGWGGSVGADRPDRVAVTLDKDVYKPGDQAVIDIRPPSSGKALVVIASDKVHLTRLMDVPETGAKFYVPVEDSWGPGVYAMVTHYRPLDSGASRAPVRSIGLAYLSVDQSARTLDVAVKLPDVARPQDAVKLPITVEGAEGPTFVTVAAVDEGILQLTNFSSPDPLKHYFGKRRLGLDIRDDYGRLITPMEGAQGELRSGGDGMAGGEGLTVVPTRSVALFSGIVDLNRSGKAEITFDLPDFVGELRVMAVAWNGRQIGKFEAPLTVRQPVVADLTLPRFLAPGDRASATLLIDNVEGAAGTYSAVLKTAGSVAGKVQAADIDLDLKQRKTVSLPINGADLGIGTVSLEVLGPKGLKIKHNWPIEVRPGQRRSSDETVARLAPGETLTLPAERFGPYVAQTAAMSVTLASSRGFDVPGLLRALDRYPYGCLEQTTSRAYPLLVFNDVASSAGIAADEGLRVRLQRSVDAVLDMQSPSGGFGMWGWSSGNAYDWLSVYALDFLIEAKARDYVVPQDALNRGTEWLRQSAAQTWQSDDIRAYGLYVLARQGGVNLADLRYYHDSGLENIKTPMAAGHLGGALAMMGDRSRARSAFARAVRLSQASLDASVFSDYGSQLRDVAGTTAVIAKLGETGYLPELFEAIEGLRTKAEFMTTQEMAWMLLAAYEVDKAQGPLEISVEGVAATGKGPVFLASVTPSDISGAKITNSGDKDVWYTISVDGVPAQPLPPINEGVTARKVYLTLDGRPADLSALRQSDKVIVLISGKMPDIRRRQMAVLDLLPAGLEVETSLGAGPQSQYAFLPELTGTDMTSARDDRFIAAFTRQGNRVRQKDGSYKDIIPDYAVAYVARAITPGDYVLPAVTVEDMYAPAIRARTGLGRLSVKAKAE